MNDLTRTTTMLLDGLRDPRNHQAWTSFLRLCRPAVLAYARRRGLQEADAEDMAQESLADFAKAYQNDQYDRSRGRLRQWLGGFVTRRTAKLLALRARNHAVAGNSSRTAMLDQLPGDDPADRIWEEEWEHHVVNLCKQQIRAEFDERHYRAFEQYALRDRPAEEVASEVGMTANAIYICKTRILSRLRELQDELADVI